MPLACPVNVLQIRNFKLCGVLSRTQRLGCCRSISRANPLGGLSARAPRGENYMKPDLKDGKEPIRELGSGEQHSGQREQRV